MHTFKMTEAQAELIFKMADQHVKALKNWTVSAVERGDIEAAQKLAAEIRAHQAIFAGFNVQAKREIALHTGRDMQISTDLRSSM
jgi:hypothetical protein